MPNSMRTLALFILAGFPLASPGGEPGATLQSWQEARAVLARALEAAGGETRIRMLANISLEYEGERHMINQSRSAYPPWDREPSSGTVVVDLKGRRMFAENYTSYPGIGKFGGAWAMKGDQGVHWEPLRNHHGSEVMMNYTAQSADSAWAMVPRWIPALMLLEAWQDGTYLRSLGSTSRRGKPLKAVAWTQRDGGMVTLLFDAGNGSFSGYETIFDDGVYGDITSRVEYSGSGPVNGVPFPSRRVEWFNDEVARDLRLVYRVDADLPESRFELPAGFSQPVAAPEGERLRKIAEGVFLDTHMGGIMIVEFRDFLVVVECPGNFAMANSTIVALREAFPAKPVRYVVPSHTHGDHGGGARAYFHAGATLLTTPVHADFYRELARVQRTIAPDPYVAAERAPSIETFRGKHVISDGEQTLVLHDVGPNAHSEELTIAHLPRQKIVWQADVYFSPGTGGGINAAMPIGVDFAKKLKALDIRDFDALLEAHNQRVVTLEEFRRALAMSGYRGY
jgi:glyoxylase-like metal-dependent hydrolase (beta-lactamase superfamily II)